MRHSLYEFQAVIELIDRGEGVTEIARATGIPRNTVKAWSEGRGVARHRRLATASPHWRPHDAKSYCYLLGIYLGDGHITAASPTAAALTVTLDPRYPAVVAEVAQAMEAVCPGAAARRFIRKGGHVAILKICHPVLPHAFPQHGPGQKHRRAIELLPWQRELTRHHSRALLRGLIQSDGCRCLNRFETTLPSGRVARYEYPRYFFSNLSADIRGIFCEHCELLGIRWTQSNSRNISVSHRASVALLDQFVGPKA